MSIPLRSDSIESHPPSGFTESEWKIVCKTPFSNDLIHWVSENLVGQDATKICSILSVRCKTPSQCGHGDREVFQKIVNEWLNNRKRKPFLSELLCPLFMSTLVVPGLKATEINRVVPEISAQDEDFVSEASGNDSPDPVSQNDSASSSGSMEIFSGLPFEVTPAGCTEEGDASALVCENASSRRICSQLVTGMGGPCRLTDISNEELQELRSEVNSFQKKFARLLRLAYRLLNNSNLSSSELRIWLIQRCADEQEEVPLFSKLMIDIVNQANPEEVFMHMSRTGAWNFLCFFMFEEVLEEFIDSETDAAQYESFNSEFSSFKSEVQAFKERTLLLKFLFVWGRKGDCDESARSVIVKSIAHHESFTIHDACKIGSLLAGQFSLKQIAFQLSSGDKGSVYIKWLVPAAVSKHIFEVMKSKKRPDLLKLGILELAVERKIFMARFKYESVYELSLNNPRIFWGGVGAKELIWRKHSREVFTHNKETGEFQWFKDAQLNVSENCLDVHVKCHPDKVALIWEKDNEKAEKVTYRELLEHTCRVANVLKKRGINKGDVVVICMPTMPLAVASMLACARIGAVHCVVFSDFNDEVLRQRIKEVRAKAVITADIRVIGGKTKNLKEKIARALSNGATSVQFVLVVKRSDTLSGKVVENRTPPCHLGDSEGLFLSMEEEMQGVSSNCDPLPMGGEDILFIVYTSGTGKGKSKAVYHTHAGYLLYTKLTYKFMFNLAPDDIMGCVSDLGWIAAHCYVVYGPLSNGNTTLLFESTATHPNEGRYWNTVQEHRLTHFYTVPSVLKELKESRVGSHIDKYDLSSLKVIASGGEPIAPDIEQWFYKRVGKEKCLYLDTWGQTELGGTGIVRWEAPEGKERLDFPSSKSFALFGVDWDKTQVGMSELFLRQPIPGMGKFVLMSGNSAKIPYAQEHFKANGFSTDDIVEHEEGTGLFRVKGRKERTQLVQGVRFSLAEIEDCLRVKYAGICDAQVISCHEEPDSLCVVLQTPPSDEPYKEKNLASFYLFSVLAAKIGHVILANLRIHIYFLQLAENMKMFFQTPTRKASNTMLKDFLELEPQQSVSSNGNTRWQDIQRNEFVKFCIHHSSLAITA